jgi:hypothetical protein
VSRKNKRNKLPPFVPVFRETWKVQAWKQLSFGARLLFVALSMSCYRNNGHVYLSLRDAGEELGHINRNDLSTWFRELQHYGFIVQTEGASLGVDGKGKAPHWRITDLPTGHGGEIRATKDFLKWDGAVFEPHVRPSRRWNETKREALEKQNPGRHVRTTVGVTFVPEVGVTFVPPEGQSGTDVSPIWDDQGGTDVSPITNLATYTLKEGAG